MLEIVRYTPDKSEEWNRFVAKSKNGTFLLNRSYMDYHADRFQDYSLMVYRRGKLYALLPGCVDGDTYYSHQGLTSTPWIYHKQPSEEDLYAIVEACGATMSRGLSSTISRECLNKWYRIRECGVKHARQLGLTVEEETDFRPFWKILTRNLKERYGLNPVHTVEEIELLHCRFPENIRLMVVKNQHETIGGTVLYITDKVVHSQYIAASSKGKEEHALDLLFYEVIEQALQTHAYFDFGISTEKHGTYLNEQLIYQKEGFGGRGICYDWYEWTL